MRRSEEKKEAAQTRRQGWRSLRQSASSRNPRTMELPCSRMGMQRRRREERSLRPPRTTRRIHRQELRSRIRRLEAWVEFFLLQWPMHPGFPTDVLSLGQTSESESARSARLRSRPRSEPGRAQLRHFHQLCKLEPG